MGRLTIAEREQEHEQQMRAERRKVLHNDAINGKSERLRREASAELRQMDELIVSETAYTALARELKDTRQELSQTQADNAKLVADFQLSQQKLDRKQAEFRAMLGTMTAQAETASRQAKIETDKQVSALKTEIAKLSLERSILTDLLPQEGRTSTCLRLYFEFRDRLSASFYLTYAQISGLTGSC